MDNDKLDLKALCFEYRNAASPQAEEWWQAIAAHVRALKKDARVDYTQLAAQVLAALDAMRRDTLEEAAKACEEYAASMDNDWNRKLGVASAHVDTCQECATAIRALAGRARGE